MGSGSGKHASGFPGSPDRRIEDKDAIFHTVYDLNDRLQISRRAHLRLGYKNDGRRGALAAIFDDKGRVMVAISYNSDIGDAWEYADDPRYPEKVRRPGNPASA